MWVYVQSTGELIRDGDVVAQGYSGHGDGKNNPAMQNVRQVGPIPCGFYDIGDPVDTISHGPFVLPLEPNPENEMFGRSGFRIHGDSKEHPGEASIGCIIMPRPVRERVHQSGDTVLKVVSE